MKPEKAENVKEKSFMGGFEDQKNNPQFKSFNNIYINNNFFQ